MRRTIYVIAFLLAGVSLNAQQSRLTLNNYTPYDFRGSLTATGLGSCHPFVSVGDPAVPSLIKVPANSHQGNDLQLEYINYAAAGSNILYPITSFNVQTSATNPGMPRVPTSPVLSPSGPVSINTDWRHTKFQMYFAGTDVKVSSGGTSIPETYFNGNLSDQSVNPCFGGSNYISTVYGEAEWFVISSGGNKYTYIQLY